MYHANLHSGTAVNSNVEGIPDESHFFLLSVIWVHMPCIDTCNWALLLGFAITAAAREQGEATALSCPEHAPQFEF